MPLLELECISKRFDRPAVQEVSLAVEKGAILCLLGPSGCGKTTLLRLIAGLETPDQGRVRFDGRDVTGTPPHKRCFGMMFQEFALFPHKSVFENVAFGLQMQGQSRRRTETRTREMLALVGLEELARRNVADLSGGERQRVALARSLAPGPRLLMLDEPLGSLDRSLRERLLLDIRSILEKLGVTTLFVTHDQSEALTVADVVAVMNRGHLLQIGKPAAVYLQPADLFVAGFLGFHNQLPGKVTGPGVIRTRLGTIQMPEKRLMPLEKVTVILRPETARWNDPAVDSGPFFNIRGKTLSRRFRGKYYRVWIGVDEETRLEIDLPNDARPPAVGDTVTIGFPPDQIVVVRENGGHPSREGEQPACGPSSLPTAR